MRISDWSSDVCSSDLTLPLVQLSTRKRSQTRERLLDFAYGAIIEKGFAATSIEELVEAAGITKSGFFYHFKDKNDLARQLLERYLAIGRESCRGGVCQYV